jgi:hypothetical protein
VPDQTIDLKRLTKIFGKFWSMYMTIVTVSPLDSNGFLTASAAGDVLMTSPEVFEWTHSEFWRALGYTLDRHNTRLKIKRGK